MTTDTAIARTATTSQTGTSQTGTSQTGTSQTGTSPPTQVHDVAIVTPGSDDADDASTASLARSLAARGLAVRVLSPHDRGAPDSSFDGLVRIDRTVARGPQWVRRALTEARREQPDVVHLEWPTRSVAASAVLASAPAVEWAARLRPAADDASDGATAPLVASLHDVAVDGDERTASASERLLRGAAIAAARLVADAVVVEAASCRAVVPEAFVIPRGMDEIVLPDRTVARRALGLDERFTVLCVGALRAHHGLEAVLEAVQLLRGGVQLVVAGMCRTRRADSEYVDALRTLYGGTAMFVEPVTEVDVGSCFAASDVVLLPSTTAAESAALFATAVASRRPMLVPAAVAHHMGLAAAMIAPLEPQALAARLHRLASAEAGVELPRLAGWTGALTQERGWAAVAARYHEIYELLVREARARDHRNGQLAEVDG